MALNNRSSPWVEGWHQTKDGWQISVLNPQNQREFVDPIHMRTARMFEPSAGAMKGLATTNVAFQCHNLQEMSPLLDPSELLKNQGLPLKGTKHSILTLEMDNFRIYIPAFLLIRDMWMWSDAAARILLTPAGLDLNVNRMILSESGNECSATLELTTKNPGDSTRRKLAWLSQCEDARKSWNSVLTNAMQGRLALFLPKASFQGWAWGVEVEGGVLACELQATQLQFELPFPQAVFRIGRRAASTLPPSQSRQSGQISF